MNLTITKEWLLRKLSEADDSFAGAGGTTVEELKMDAQRRTVTPGVFVASNSQLGMVICYIREQRGWSRSQLAQIASISESEITALETDPKCVPSPRAVIYLADALGLSRERLKELVGFVRPKTKAANDDGRALKFAANGRNIGCVSPEEYEAVRALVEVLTDEKPKRP